MVTAIGNFTACSDARPTGIEVLAGTDDRLAIGDREPGCGYGGSGTLTLLGSDGSTIWERAVPGPNAEFAVIGGSVIGTSWRDGNPGSVWSIGVTDGDARWQYFARGDSPRLAGRVGDRAVVEFEDTLTTFDAAGSTTAIADIDPSLTRVAVVDDSVLLSDGDGEYRWLEPNGSSTIVDSAAIGNWRVVTGHPAVVIAGAGTVTWLDRGEPVPRWTTRLRGDGATNAPDIDDVTATPDAVMVDLEGGGQDHETVVLDPTTGAVRFHIHARNVAIAGDALLVDRAGPFDAAAGTPTRVLGAVDLITGADLGWQTRSNGVLGGYVGMIDPAAVFVQSDATGALHLSRRDPRTGDVVAGVAGELDHAEPGTVFIGETARLVRVGDTYEVVAGNRIARFRRDSDTSYWIDAGDLPVIATANTDVGVLVLRGPPAYGCD